ncbi:MAG: serine hydrolase [Candidatus Pseudobacter hemicellulosilyticus]|uniref:Serine hydrolase n=1 Tax=Candidatus Pseudobacter hemicellulosilyticus TaxID=3121375 RepID=A0AAJ6BHW4_9BACT|nr:MAG: serine hydrolase [Pseudobacter sp.]
MSLKTKQICLHCSLVAFFLLLLQSTSAQVDTAAISQLLQKNQKQLSSNVAALVWKDGKVIYQKELGEYFTSKIQAPAGMASQWLTAAVVMAVVADGKLSLDDEVGKYLPVMKSYMKGYITIRHCLANITGIENEKSLAKILNRRSAETLEDEVAKNIAPREIINNTGKEFHYGGLGPSIAARVVEIVTRKSFERVAQEKIFRPLKMKNTNFGNDGRAPYAAGGAVTTANDYLNFLIMLLNKGQFEGKQVLSEQAIAEIEKAQMSGLPVKFMPKPMEGSEYGLGVFIQENGKLISSPGFNGVWPWIDRCRNYAFILLPGAPLNDPRKELADQLRQLLEAGISCQ